MKHILYSIALATVVMFGFSSCGEKEEETTKDLRDDIVGTYSCVFNYAFSNDGVNFNVSKEEAMKGGCEFALGYSAVSVTKEDNDVVAIILSDEGKIIGTSFSEMGADGIAFNVKEAHFRGANCTVEKSASPYDCVYSTLVNDLHIVLVANVEDVKGMEPITEYSKVKIWIELEKN